MIILCPDCSKPYELPASQVSALVQVACPHCAHAVILDFEAANDPSLQEPGHRLTSGFLSREDYEQSLQDGVGSPAANRAPVQDTPQAADTVIPPKRTNTLPLDAEALRAPSVKAEPPEQTAAAAQEPKKAPEPKAPVEAKAPPAIAPEPKAPVKSPEAKTPGRPSTKASAPVKTSPVNAPVVHNKVPTSPPKRRAPTPPPVLPPAPRRSTTKAPPTPPSSQPLASSAKVPEVAPTKVRPTTSTPRADAPSFPDLGPGFGDAAPDLPPMAQTDESGRPHTVQIDLNRPSPGDEIYAPAQAELASTGDDAPATTQGNAAAPHTPAAKPSVAPQQPLDTMDEDLDIQTSSKRWLWWIIAILLLAGGGLFGWNMMQAQSSDGSSLLQDGGKR